MKFFKLITILTLLCSLNFFIDKAYNSSPKNNSPHRILIMNTMNNVGGGEIYAINLYKTLLNKGIFATFLTSQNAKLKTLLRTAKLPFYTCKISTISSRAFNTNPFYRLGLQKVISEICKKHHISIIHCNRLIEVICAHAVASKIPVKIFYTHHIIDPISPAESSLIDGVITVKAPPDKIFVQPQATHRHLHQKATCIPPFCNEEKFLTFTPTLSRKDFFQEMFTIKILENMPVICLIGHFYGNRSKNHALLLKAAHKLIYEKKKPIQLIFVGSGETWSYRKLAQKYNINDYTHFLEATDKIPELLFYSDINILPSTKEAFGIVVLEGVFMKKPTIVSSVIGAARTMILHEKTGLIFENNNVDSLVENIERCLDNPEFAKQLGENAYHHALEHFSNKANFEKLLAFYDQVTQVN